MQGRKFIMQAPVEVAFRHYQPSDEVRAEVAAEALRLERINPRIRRCQVVVTGPRKRRNGDLFEVEVRVRMPGRKDVIVGRRHGDAPEHAHALVAIRSAFDAAKRQVEDAERAARGDAGAHAAERRGRMAKLIAGGDYGFIETTDGREIFVHRNAVSNGAFDRLAVGDEVRFVEEEGEQGPQASAARLVARRRL